MMGLGRPTDLLGFTFEDPHEKLIWDHTITTRALELLKSASEGKDKPKSDRLKEMRRLREEKRCQL